MFDLQVLALQGDVTRVITFQLARETSIADLSRDRRSRSAPPADAPRQRSGKDRAGWPRSTVPRLAVRRVPRQAEGHARRERHRCWTIRSISTAAAWAIPTSTTTRTCRSSSPVGAAGKMKGGQHIRYEKPTPLANLHLTLLDKVGVRLDSFRRQPGKDRRPVRAAPDLSTRGDRRSQRSETNLDGFETQTQRMGHLLVSCWSASSRSCGADAPLADAAEKADRPRVRALLDQRADVQSVLRSTA